MAHATFSSAAATSNPAAPAATGRGHHDAAARLLVIRHDDKAGTGLADPTLAAEGLQFDIRRSGVDELPESLRGYAGLLVYGGALSAFEDDGFPERRHEIGLFAEAVAHEVPALGICLGAQLLSAAAGGTGYRGDGPELGWTPVRLTPAATHDVLFTGLPRGIDVMQSHRDHYVLPDDATVLATNDAYPSQAFRVGRAAWGLQFHLEADATFQPGRHGLLPDGDPRRDERDDPRLAAVISPVAKMVFRRFARLANAYATQLCVAA
jgi:GMP synthase-like glutamine amidotransferase